MLEKGSQSAADEVFLDLEDSVAPSAKVESRDTVVRAINDFDWSDKLVCVRVNGLDTRWFYGDLIKIVEGAGATLGTIMLPKANSAADVYMVDTLLTQIEENNDLSFPQRDVQRHQVRRPWQHDHL